MVNGKILPRQVTMRGYVMNKSKQNKQKARQERLRIEKHKSSIRSLYPNIIYFNENVVSKEFAELVKEEVAKLDYEKFVKRLATFEQVLKFLKVMKKIGFLGSYQVLFENELLLMADKVKTPNTGWIARHVNKFVYSFLMVVGTEIIYDKRNEFFKFWPEQGFRLVYMNENIAVVFQRITKTVTDDNQTLFSPMLPLKTNHNNKNYKVCFTRHAIDRIIDRFTQEAGDYNMYVKYVSIYEFLLHCCPKLTSSLKYDAIKRQNEPYLQFYFPTELDPFASAKKLDKHPTNMQSLQKDSLPFIDYKNKKVLRPFNVFFNCLGSPCAIDEEHERIICITCLLPGHFPSPESILLTKKNITDVKKQDKIRHAFFGKIHGKSEDYVDALRFFHANGKHQMFLGEPINKKHPCNITQFYMKPADIPEYVRSTI